LRAPTPRTMSSIGGPTIQLNSAFEMPVLGFGTFLAKPGEVGAAVRDAISQGYRHIDCAAAYSNEDEIGRVLQEIFNDAKSGVKRENLFITSKLSAFQMQPKNIGPCLRKTLSDLQTSYLDLYLVHIPVAVRKNATTGAVEPDRQCSLQDVWRELESAVSLRLVRSIGISNFNVQTLNDLLNYCRIKPSVQQIERHPYLQQRGMMSLCKSENIAVTACKRARERERERERERFCC
jgi:alcohol dehydrogenase (NADP+)